MANDPGESTRQPSDPAASTERRRLSTPPSERYVARDDHAVAAAGRASATGPLAKAALVAFAGAVVLVVVGAVFASTFGLLFVAAITGAVVGLVLARARVPGDAGAPALTRRAVSWLSIALAVGAVAAAALATWLIARGEGGTLGPIDYLLTTFGPFVPAEAILAALGAAWGAGAGPIKS